MGTKSGTTGWTRAGETGRTWWTVVLDAVRPGPADDATAVTAAQLRQVVERLLAAGRWSDGDPDIPIAGDAGHHITRLAFVLGDLPVEPAGGIRPRPGAAPARTAPPGSTTRAGCPSSRAP